MSLQKKQKFFADVVWLLISSVITLVIKFFQKPVVARFLGPEGIGLYMLAVMTIDIFALVGAFGVPAAVVKYVAEYKDQKNKLQSLVSSALIIMFISGAMLSFLLFVMSDVIASIFNTPTLSSLVKLYALVIPFSFVYTVILSTFNGLREMKCYSFIDVSKNTMTFLFIVSFLFLGFGVEGVLIGTIIGMIAGLVVSVVFFKKKIAFSSFNLRQNTKELTSFGSRLMLTDAVNLINYRLDVLMIGYFLTVTDVGYYSVAIAFSQFFWIVPLAIQKVSFPATSEYWADNDNRSLNKMIDKCLKSSAVILLTMGLGLWFFTEDAITLLFGHQFISAVVPFRILMIGTVFLGIFKSIGPTLSAIGYPGVGFKINATGAVVNILLNITLIPHFGINGAATATITSFIIMIVLNIYFIKKLAKIRFDFKWHFAVFGIAFCAIAGYSIFSEFMNRYLVGSLILVIYAVIIFQYLLSKDDKETFKEIIGSTVRYSKK